jgi:hypothetical protein
VAPGGLGDGFAIKVTNDKSEDQTFFDRVQYAYDAAARKFSADGTGGIMEGDQDAPSVKIIPAARPRTQTLALGGALAWMGSCPEVRPD